MLDFFIKYTFQDFRYLQPLAARGVFLLQELLVSMLHVRIYEFILVAYIFLLSIYLGEFDYSDFPWDLHVISFNIIV